MKTENSVYKRSFFKEYFFYKLGGLRGVIITSSVMSLFFVVAGISIFSSAVQTVQNNYENMYFDPVAASLTTMGFLLAAVVIGLVILSLISAVTVFKFYTSRSSMDTIGCLPLTYGQRFLGDFLSGLSAVVGPVLVSGLIGGVFWLMTQGIVDKNPEKFENTYLTLMYVEDGKYFMLGAATFIIVLIMIVSTYSLTALVVSCCGKVGNSVLYSIIAAPILPVVFIVFGMYMINQAVGVNADTEIASGVSAFPPVGVAISIYLGIQNYYMDGYCIMDNPLILVFALVFIAVMIAAAYFIGKRRKTERVGSGFVIKSAYHVITILLVILAIGVFALANTYSLTASRVLTGVIIILVFYLILEMVQYRSFKVLWKSIIRYAAVVVAGFGFLFIAKNTSGFGIEKYLPNQNSIEEVWVSGNGFYGSYYYTMSRGGSYVYRDSGAISAILEEHQKLIDNIDKLKTAERYTYVDEDTQSRISISYQLKNGISVTRSYYGDKELINSASDKILEQPVFEVEKLKILDTADYTDLSVEFITYTDEGRSVHYVKGEKFGELFALLKDDILNNYDYTNRLEEKGGYLTFRTKDGEYITDFEIYQSCTKTLEFLNNSDNVSTVGESSNEVTEYELYYSGEESIGNISSISVRISSDSSSEYVQELISLFEPNNGDEERISDISIYDTNTWGHNNIISIDNEAEALQLMLKIIAEQVNQV